MRIYILQKSITDLKNPIKKKEYNTNAIFIEDFIKEMVTKNYAIYNKGILSEHIQYALEEFTDGSYYIINQTKNHKYEFLDEKVSFDEEDEIILIKLKYVRGIIWML